MKKIEKTEREEFVRYATDRLKTPVTVIGLALHQMEDAKNEEERKEYLEMAKRGQQEMSQAVEGVLNKARQDKRRK